MKTPIIFAISSVSLAIMSCGGGGGGSSTNASETTAKAAYSSQGIPIVQRDSTAVTYGYNDSYKVARWENAANPPDEYRPDGFKTTKSYTVNLVDGRKLEVFDDYRDNKLRQVVLLDGKPIEFTDVIKARTYWNNNLSPNQDISTFNQGIGYTYLTPDGKPHSMYMFDHQALEGTKLAPRSDQQWTWNNVEYGFAAVSASPSEMPTELWTQPGGTISVNGDQWNAALGPVTLKGTISGTDVRGTATGNFYGRELTGEFAGSDGVITTKDGKTNNFTFGGFAGGDESAAFTGGWSNGSQN